jgi:SAM-dependent methyltransferase
MNLIIRKIYSLAQIFIPFPIKILLRKSVWKFLYFKLIIRNFFQGKQLYNKVYCPISETYFAEFVPLFKKWDPALPSHAQSRISPDSGAREGLRLQWLYLKHETDLMKDNINLLHFGPEYCFYRMFKEMNNINYYPADKNNKKYSKDIKYVDLAELNIETNTFEMIICNHVLEHVEDDKKAVMEMYRVLKPGGVAIITVPIDSKRNETYEDLSVTKPKDREREFGQWDHLRYYGLDFQQRLETADFTVKTEHYARSFSNGDYEKYGLADEPIFVCKKR